MKIVVSCSPKTKYCNNNSNQTINRSHCYHLCQSERTRAERTACISGHLSIESTSIDLFHSTDQWVPYVKITFIWRCFHTIYKVKTVSLWWPLLDFSPSLEYISVLLTLTHACHSKAASHLWAGAAGWAPPGSSGSGTGTSCGTSSAGLCALTCAGSRPPSPRTAPRSWWSARTGWTAAAWSSPW